MLEIWGLFVDVRCSRGDYSTICLKFEDFLSMFVAGGDSSTICSKFEDFLLMFVAQEEMIRAMAMEQKRKKQMKENSYIHRPEISTMNLVA